MELPEGVYEMAARGPRWARWVEGLPRLTGELVEEWQLTGEGAAQHGHCSLVLPARTGSGRPVVLKVGFPDEESEHEHLALQHWHGRGAVQLVRADPRRRGLLLERLHEPLTVLDPLAACELVAGLYGQLHRPALPQLRRLTTLLDRWSAQLSALPRSAPVPRRLVEQALSLARDFRDDPATDGILLHGDLHDHNVLAGDRQEWLAIDPKPLSGDPHLEPAPMLWNRWNEAVASRDVRTAVRARFHTLVDASGLEEERVRGWAVLRVVLNAVWELDGPGPPDRDEITRSITIAKAVQD